jgi:K+-sensing histidine kinase KdpD
MKDLIILQELSTGNHYEVELPCVVGRSKSADLQFSDPAISHRHALIGEEHEQIWIEDLGSSNGVYVNDKRIAARTVLRTGDFLQLGQTRLIISSEERKAAEQTIILHSVDVKTESELDRERLKLIHEITTQLSGNQDLEVLAQQVSTRFKEIFNQDRGYLALFQKDGSLKPLLPNASSASIPLSRSIVKRLFQTGESLLLSDALNDDELREEESILGQKIRSALCAPLIFHGRIYGLIYLDRNIPGAYDQEDLEFLRIIASIVAPLIENARLWSDLKSHYANALETLKQTQERLIETEREAAYVRLAQAMAHEIRNPLTAIGGLVRRLTKSESDASNTEKLTAILSSVERIETVMREVDDFVRFPPPKKSLARIDSIFNEQLDNHNAEWQKHDIHPALSLETSNLMISLDIDLFAKAISMIFKEIIPIVSPGSSLSILVRDVLNEIEIVFGEADERRQFFEPSAPELLRKPWSLTLFLNIAHKIISDHGGKLLFDPEAHSALPIIIRLPRTTDV